MPLGREVGLGPGKIVLDWDPVLSKKGHSTPLPLFGPCLLWPNGWMNQDATWYEGRPWPRPHCVRLEPSSPLKGAQQPPLSGPCLLWFVDKRSPISATAEHLFNHIIHRTSDYLAYVISELKRTVTVIVNLPFTYNTCRRATLWNAELIHLMEGILVPSKCWWLWKGELCCVLLVAVKRADCVSWQLEC